MKIRLMVSAVVLAGVVGLFWPVVAASAQVIGPLANGNFDCTSCSGPMTTLYQVDSTSMAPWRVTQNSVDWNSTYFQQPPDSASYTVDMNGTTGNGYKAANGQIEQTFATTKGATYFVSFDLSGNFNYLGSSACPLPASGQSQTLYVAAPVPPSLGGPLGTAYTFDYFSGYTYKNMGWTSQGYSFIATGTSSTLTFTADPNNTTNCGPVLANVAVTPEATLSCNASYTSCSGSLTSPNTNASLTTSSSDPFRLQAYFSAAGLNCDSSVSSGTANPLVVVSYPDPSASASSAVKGTITLTFSKTVVHEIPGNKGTPHMPVCVGATQKFPVVNGTYYTGNKSYPRPYPYQGLLYGCNDPIYQAEAADRSTYPLQVCVASYARVHGAEQVVIDANPLGDPMFW